MVDNILRNNKKNSDKLASTLQLIDSVKLLSFWWLKTKILNIAFDYHRWGALPFIMYEHRLILLYLFPL